ncbi:ABC transporter ATP-binding protein/permease [Cyanobium sp. Cruz CV13-4-11]|uniref:ABC transporter ATP-binding protein/permease n=1 Tax=unclassified Cyanobium TaxID=2627006 RepID=UPI0020CE4280|nr:MULTISPECIES: ABC transporter ATP-binding protein/permease [unclassified Cyanobium]MCP9901282.1 ABC transporter ATP-binding protein/permease [Cyanobium sp. Cruz CV11-17]MCP9920345.1 ABC transporter ATP-binding protein/permease [Cyanobium sp. Cruz CV13-4-11]
MTPLKALREQLGKLQRLAQPYFLPLDEGGGGSGQFLLLVVALLAVVVGFTLLLLTGVVAAAGAWIPELRNRFLPGVPEQVAAVWKGPIGLVIMVLFAAGLGAFISLRAKLRQGRWLPWLLLGIIALLILVINGINVGISFIARNIENALVAYKAEEFWKIVAIYAFCLVLALPIRAIQSYLIPKLGLLWREWLSGRMLGRYLTNRAYYVLNPNDESVEEIDNPDQRISQDAASFTATSLSVTVEIISALLTFFSFIIVLWSINQTLALWLLGYSVGGTALIVFASRKLVNLNYQQLKLEADFRYGLVHIRDNAESIAFYRGERQEQKEGERRLDGVIVNYNRLIIWEALISVIQRSYDYFSRFLPWLVIAPIYFAKQVDFGVFGQASIAFSQVLFSVSYIVNNIDRLAAFSASISRLEGFQGKVESISAEMAEFVAAEQASAGGAMGAGAGAVRPESILVSNVNLVPPRTNRLLVRDLSLEVTANQRLLVVGPSGCGKTSFLRLVSGLWPPAAGNVQRPPVGELMFIPQKPYMLLGSLREQLCYPQPTDRFSDEQLRHVLEEVRLPELVHRYPDLDIKQDWPRLLSLGEQQRLAFARLLLNSPRFVVLDEATSALDVATEKALYELLVEREMAFVSVGHRPTLTAYHDTVLELDGNGGWRLLPAAGYTFGRQD